MRPWPLPALVAAGVAVSSAVALPAAALSIRIMSGSQAGAPSTFQRDPNAPRSTFTPVAASSTLESVFVASEVAPARMETTKSLLSELSARRSEGSIVVDLPADVLFDFDKAVLRPDAAPALRKAAELLKSYPSAAISIGGHTDAKGDDAYNQALSMRRARAVANRLTAAASRPLSAEGFGETQPVAPNTHTDGSDNPAGRQQNRRVEIRITPTPQSGD